MSNDCAHILNNVVLENLGRRCFWVEICPLEKGQDRYEVHLTEPAARRSAAVTANGAYTDLVLRLKCCQNACLPQAFGLTSCLKLCPALPPPYDALPPPSECYMLPAAVFFDLLRWCAKLLGRAVPSCSTDWHGARLWSSMATSLCGALRTDALCRMLCDRWRGELHVDSQHRSTSPSAHDYACGG